MKEFTRRSFVASASAAGLAFGLKGPIEFFGPAFAQGSDKGFVKFKVGDIEVIQMYDGIWNKAHDPGFVKNASLDDVKAGLKAGGLTDEHVPITFTVTAVRIGGKVVLFDSGTGAQMAPTAGHITNNKVMAAAGIDPATVETIVVTHFHPDHISGLMAKDTNEPIFPKAEIHVPAAEYKHWTNPAVTAGAAKRIQAVFPNWKNIKQIEGETDVVPGVRAIASAGHTPGHTSYLVSSGSSQLIVLGDIANVPALFVKNPGWHVVFDADPQLAETNRRKIFDRAVADRIIVAGYHFGIPGAGTIAKDGAGYAFVPVKDAS